VFPVKIIHAKAEQLGLRYLVIGGHAFNTYGVPRATVDVDFLISRDERKGWTELLRESGFKLLRESSTVLVFAPADGIEWYLDMIVVNDDTLAKLYGAANEVEMLGVKTRVPSLEHFMALKLHTVKFGPRHERDQDLCDVLTLTRSAEIDVRAEPFQRLVEQFGTPEIYERILWSTPVRSRL
jgi:predicted nucleotidyltransferase